MPPSGHAITLWTVPPESPLPPQVILVLTQDSCSAPGLHDREPRLRNWWQRKASFWTILFCCNKTYLPQTFLKQKPVKICFQKNPATIIDNNKNWLEKCFLIHPNLQSLGFFFHPAMETAETTLHLQKHSSFLPAPCEENRSKELWRGHFQVQSKTADTDCETGWDLGPGTLCCSAGTCANTRHYK